MADDDALSLSGTTLKQVQIHYAGCQLWNKRILAAAPSGQIVAYASTLSICVYDISRKPISLKRLITTPSKTFSALVWSPVDDDHFASGSVDGTLVLWCLSAYSDEREHAATLSSPVVDMAWG